MKLKYKFEIVQIDSEVMAVSLDSGFKGSVKLNPTARIIFEAMQTETTKEQLVDKCLEEYPGTDPERIAAAVDTLVQKLQDEGLVE